MRKLATLAALLICGVAVAGTIHVWATGEYITASDLNSNFAHIHNTMVGGHGPRLVNADVSSSANIATSKLAAAPYIPRGWGSVAGGAFTVQTGLSSVSSGGTGLYTVVFPARPDTLYAAQVASSDSAISCAGTVASTSTVTVTCKTNTSAALTNSGFTIVLYDNN